ncbi:hypothetical protein, partial [Myroides odoratus]|uniref:hypothetical protein n=1 Tax=Myroides odoratus TaxID=256 RepID=UPI003342DF45
SQSTILTLTSSHRPTKNKPHDEQRANLTNLTNPLAVIYPIFTPTCATAFAIESSTFDVN